MNIQMEIVKDRHPEDRNGVYIWVDDVADQYEHWATSDPDELMDKPEPTVFLDSDKINRFVIEWLRGPEGPTGPMGATGASGA